MCGDELQVLLPVTASSPECWVDVPPLLARAQLLSDTHMIPLGIAGGTSF